MYIGLGNFGSILHDSIFWHTLLRTVVFTAANVTLTIVGGTLIALLLKRLWTWVRVLLTVGLILVWAMPPVVQKGVELDDERPERRAQLHPSPRCISAITRQEHNWFGSFVLPARHGHEPHRLGGASLRRDHGLRGALSQVPHELVEAAEIDGARAWRVFKDVTMPVIAPILYLLTCLSILWDFGVFTQAYLLIGQPAITTSNYLMGIYLFEEAYIKNDYGRGAAISILMLVTVAAMSIFYVRRMVRVGEVT